MAVGFPTKANWAAGDVLTASAQDDLAGTVNLLSNASAATGSQLVSNVAGTSFAYQATPSASNPVLNAAFNVWQRGTSFTIAASTVTYTADRWAEYRSVTGMTVTRQATGDTTNLPFIQYCMRVARDSGNTSTSQLQTAQGFETINSIPFAGKTVALSFYARAGANYSATSNALTVQLIGGTGTDQGPYSYTGTTTPINTTATLTTTWQRFTYSGAVASTVTELAPRFLFDPTGTAGANDYFEITGVQIDIGSVALPFRTYAATYQGELASCQRYYYQITSSFAVYQTFCNGYVASGTTTLEGQVTFPVTMRTSPVAAFSSASTFRTIISGAAPTLTSIGSTNIYPYGARIDGGTSGLTTGYGGEIQSNNTNSAYMAFSAEL